MVVHKMTETSKTTCPIRDVAELLSDTWTILILHALREKPLRFCELERWLEHISTRTLTLKLNKLQLQGLIEKQSDNCYTITTKGSGLKIIEEAMVRYAKKYL
jgi:DNA-binding HxlR family transcriptional regulator